MENCAILKSDRKRATTMARKSKWTIGEAIRQLTLPDLKFLELDLRQSNFAHAQQLIYTPRTNIRKVDFYPTFTAVINADGSPWLDASLYLYDCAYEESEHYKTLAKRAADLADFKRVIDEEGIDYLSASRDKFKRPTYFYLSHLQYQIDNDHWGRGYADRKITAVHNFYKWLVKTQRINPKYPLWSYTIETRSETDDKGFTRPVEFIKSDLKIEKLDSSKQPQDYVMDGGKLRPMSFEEKTIFHSAITNTCTPEIILASEIALDTGAREQTVFGLREKDLDNLHTYSDERGDSRFAIDVGGRTGVDTKSGTKFKLFISSKTLEIIGTYLKSERRLARVRLAKPKPQGEQYVFLTKYGNPFYQSDSDRVEWKNKTPSDGAAVRLIITTKLVPEIRRLGGVFTFSFHDLRATFAVDTYRGLLEKGVSSFRAKSLVAGLLGHSNLKTVDDYIQCGESRQILIAAQRKHEENLYGKL
jgi:integrase